MVVLRNIAVSRKMGCVAKSPLSVFGSPVAVVLKAGSCLRKNVLVLSFTSF